MNTKETTEFLKNLPPFVSVANACMLHSIANRYEKLAEIAEAAKVWDTLGEDARTPDHEFEAAQVRLETLVRAYFL